MYCKMAEKKTKRKKNPTTEKCVTFVDIGLSHMVTGLFTRWFPFLFVLGGGGFCSHFGLYIIVVLCNVFGLFFLEGLMHIQ